MGSPIGDHIGGIGVSTTVPQALIAQEELTSFLNGE